MLVGVLVDVFGVLMSLGGSAGSAHRMPEELVDRPGGVCVYFAVTVTWGYGRFGPLSVGVVG